MSPEELMLHILALDPDASVSYSTYTQQWYVNSLLGIGDGSVMTGITEHCASAPAAIVGFFNRLTETSTDEYVVGRYHGHRREWRWNGAAFAECTRDEVLDRDADRRAAERARHAAVSA